MIDNINDLKKRLAARISEAGLVSECLSDGAFNARVAIVAEAPGDREVALHQPLVGGSGQVLWNALRRYKMNRTQVYVTNLCKRKLITAGPKSNVGADEMQHWTALLRWELSQLPNLECVLILGGPALFALTGERAIMQWRGSVVDVNLTQIDTHVDMLPTVRRKTVKGVCTYNPAMVMREPKTEVVFRMDLHKLDQVLRDVFKPHEIEHHINPSPDEAVQWLDKMQDEKLPISYDIETTGNETACVGFANNPHEGMCINYRTRSTNRWTLREEVQVRMRMAKLFADDSMQFVAQNANFDMTWLWYKDRIQVHRTWFDTMLAHHTLYSQLPHNLGFLTAQYTNHPYYKDDGKTWREGGDIDEFWKYNVKDVCITRMCQMRMLEELKHFGQDEFFFGHVMRAQPELVKMTVGGLRVDKSLKAKISADLGKQVEQLRAEFVERAREATHDKELLVNPNSPKQLSELFFNKLKLVGRGPSTDAMNVKRMIDHPRTSNKARSMLNALSTYKVEAKFLSTYAEMEIDPDGRVRCEYRQTGVQSAPGRLSSSKVMWGSGMNLQNQPERAYEMFLADEGYCLLYFDLSQAEARVVAWLAKIASWIEQFEQARLDGSYDCHRALASEMFGIAYDDVPTADRIDGHVTSRFIAKRCRHGLNYRMAPDRLAQTTGLPMSEAVAAYHTYHRITPELRQWWDREADAVRKTRQLVSPLGRVLRIMERLTDEALESIIAFKPQSTIGDHVTRVIYRSHDDDMWPKSARICLNIHDALIALVPFSMVLRCARVMKKHAETPIMIDGNPLIIPAEFAVSTRVNGHHRWSSLKKAKTLDGLWDIVKQESAA